MTKVHSNTEICMEIGRAGHVDSMLRNEGISTLYPEKFCLAGDWDIG